TAVAAYALTGFKVRELGPIQGGVNFAISNTVGAYMILVGIALLYGRTGALNLAQLGHVLDRAKPDGLVIVALTLVFVGFLVKAAIVPFHLRGRVASRPISDLGAMLVGIALLDSKGLAGTADLVLAHALLKAGLFLACGILARKLHNVDELRLRGRGRELPVVGVLFGLGAVGLIG